MAETRIKFSNIVKNQLPTYVENEFPLISEFLKQYYIGQEYKSGPVDLIQNIDQYTKIDEQTGLNHFVVLNGDLDEFATTINLKSGSTTDKFPDSYGLLKIGDEVITYTGKTTTSFTGCIRGFVGVTSYKSDSDPGDLVFSSTSAAEHKDNATIENLSCLFLKEFLNKSKIQLLPGLSDRPLSSDLNQNVFIKQAKDFYTSKGTDDSYKILFKALYGVNVEITKPRDYLFTPSNARNLVTSNFLVESIDGDPSDLESRTIFQGDNDETYTAIYDIEKVNAGTGKTFYKLSFDDGYNRDSRSQGSTVGTFKVAPKTHIIGNVSAGSTFIDVDSTIGFPNSGEIYVHYPNAPVDTVGIVSYTSKTITQFLGCSNITDTLIDGDTLSTEDFASVKPSEEPPIEVRITPVLSGFSKQDGIFDYKPEDKFDIKTLGIEDDSFKFKNWLYNNPAKYAINKIELISSVSPKTYKLTLNKENYLFLGDSVKIENLVGSESHDAEVIDIITDKVVVIKTTGTINVASTYTLLKQLRKAKSATISGVNKFHANVQNIYKKQYGDSVLIASNSLPSFKDVPLVASKGFKTFSGTFSGETFTINDHGFYTGESVYYTPQRTQTTVEIDGEDVIDTSVQSSLFGGDTGGEGVYYVHRVDSNNIKLAKSPANLYTSNFVNISTTTVASNTIELTETSNRVIDSQRLYREVSTPINNDVEVETTPGATGILINGVEILNYKSKDIIHTGKVEKIDVSSPGNGFDVINPPDLVITDSSGSGASGFLAVSGELQEIQIIDRGFDFTETPTVSITGGNGSNARALVNTKLISHSVEFFSDVQSAKVSIGANNSTIGFSTYHKFRNGEQVVYNPNSQQVVGGLSTSATYFAEIIDATTIKLHNTLEEAIVGINTVVLSSHGIGKHTLECTSSKSVIDSINIIDSGTGYENKKRTVVSAGINTSSDIITIENHDYKSGEVLRYSAGTSVIGGLSDGTNYYATVIDSNQFRLSEIGPTTDENFFYRTKQYVNLTSSGTGTQIFNYPPISVTVEGPVGIATVTGIESSAYKAEVQPIFRGELTSVHLSNKGSGYGTNDIINFDKLPDVTVTSGVNAQVKPIVTADGRIIEVIIENVGSNYTSIPNLEIISTTGLGCVLTPIFSNGRLSEVKVIEPGTGYVSGDVTIEITPSEDDFSFIPQVQRWRVNLFEKLYNNNLIGSDDTVAQRSLNDNYGLQCYSLYAPRPLREMVYSVSEGGDILYGKPDLKLVNSQETEFTDHSPIIGWAYDGNPIYGPYGYSNNNGGIVTLMRSSYRLNTSRTDGPSVTTFPLGFFIEDFTYYENDDDSYLDRNNGRFCVTPEYPNGTYAYFVTVNPDSIESSGLFENYKIPTFPYVLGDKYHSTPNEFNFSKSSNQDDYDIVANNWCRNTISYNLRESGIDYPYIYSPNNLSQTGKIVSTNRGRVSRVDVKSAGDNYKVGDTLNFSGDVTGFGAAGRVSRLKGRSVNSLSAAITEISNAEFIPSNKKGSYLVETTSPHNFIDLDIVNVSGISTTSSKIEGFYTVGVSSEKFSIVGLGTVGVAVGDTSITGLVTFFNVSSSLIDSNIIPNDILGIGTEQVKVLNVDKENSRFRVLREVNGTVGSTHTIGSILTEIPRRFEINSGFKTRYAFQKNKEIYFEPQETVGLGTTAVGIGSVLQFDSFGLNTVGLGTTFGASSLAVPIKSLYFKDHNLQTGDLLTYSPNGGQGIVYNDNGEIGVAKTLTDGQQLFVAKISKDLIGIATQRVGIGSTGGFIGIGNTTTTLFFTELGTGRNHSFTTNYDNITGNLAKRTVTVTTDVNHGVRAGHFVDIDVNPSFATTYVVKYNDANRRVLVGIETFSDVGVNTTTNTITISNHGYESGDKVIHSSTTPCQGLENDKIYYIVKVDDDNFKLSNTYHDSTKLIPSIVGIASTSFGEFGLVNPSIKAFRSSTLNFDLSDSSLGFVQQSTDYSAFRLNFYLDDTYTRRWETDGSSSTFSVSRTGIPGTSSANVSVSIGNTTPERLYYSLDPVSDANLPTVKSEIIKDSEILNYNTIITQNSIYNGNRRISVAGTNFFEFELPQNPESNSYVSTSSSITYTTDCTHTTGPISAVEVTSAGKNYTTLPSIESINSIEGVRGDLVSVSEDIGVIEKVKINDVGYDFPTDSTLKPSASLPQIINVDSFAKVELIDIVSGGRGYTAAPELLFFDGKTGDQITDISTKYSLGDSEVTILSNTRGINNATPTVLPIKNTNGVGISTVGFNTVTKDVTVTMAIGFSTSFPFEVGDQVMIENISTVGVGTTIKGYNSKEYGYKLFTLNAVTPNIGGIGSVAYNLSNELGEGEIPGEFDVVNSSGQIIAQKNFPTFEVLLSTGDYLDGEKVTTNGKEGIVQSWDRTTKTLRVLSSDNFVEGEVIRGLTSELSGTSLNVTSYESYFETDVSAQIFSGNQTGSGFLNDNLQRIQDNFYYQNFSYSLKSTIPFDDWNDAVSSVNHTLGYKKFGDLQVESTNSDVSMRVGISTELTEVSVVSSLDGFVDTNCVFDFDIATENNVNLSDGSVLSDEIILDNKILTDFTESSGNRVLSIDDISTQFNSNPRATAFSILDSFNLDDVRFRKYFTYLKDKRFTQERQGLIVDLIHDGNVGYLNQYARVESVYDQGSFDFSISGSDGQLLFFPTKSSINDYHLTSISYNLNDNYLSTGSTSIGGVLIDSNSTIINSGSSATIVSIGNTYHSLKVLVEITPDVTNPSLGNGATINGNEFEAQELNIVHDGSDVSILEYGKLTTSPGGLSATGFGTYTAYLDGSNIKVDFNPSGIGTNAVVNAIVVGLSSVSSGISTLDLKHARLQSTTTNIASSGSPTENVITEYPSHLDVAEDRYDAGYFMIQVHDTTNDRYEFLEYFVVDDHIEGETTGETFDTEWANIQTHSGLGTFGSRLIADSVGLAATTQVLFTPVAGIDATVHVYTNALRIEDDSKDTINFNNGTIETGSGDYTGTERDIMRSFNLTHKNDPIFERVITAGSGINTSSNSITVPNHFYVTGEQIEYANPGIGNSGSIGIALTTFPVTGVTTSLLPTTGIFVVKINDNTIKLARSAEDALKSIPQVLDLTSIGDLGVGAAHTFTSTNQNAKVLVAIDNLIQSPIVSTAVTTTLEDDVVSTDNTVDFTGITSFFGGDLIKVGDEIMKVEGVGIGSTNRLSVRRGWMGTNIQTGISSGDLVTKVVGNYNIVANTLTFSEAPYGNIPVGSPTNPPDQRDYIGISTSSMFQGRSFMRTAQPNTTNETYYKNYIFDDLSDQFNGVENEFTLKSDGSNITGINNEGAIVLVNDIFQIIGEQNNFTLSESTGITSITFVGAGRTTQSAFLESMSEDVGVSTFPRGGMLVSVGSSAGFGLQPLVAAGGTAVVSSAGTISAISIGNSGSGYRSGTQLVNVSVGISSLSTDNIVAIGTALISNGHVTGVTITNPGSGYTTTNPPFVAFDSPLSYTNLPLDYVSGTTGFGTAATIDVVVGQGSSVIDFEINNTGYGYGNGERLTVSVGGTTGIPTTSSFVSTDIFEIQVEKVINDEFTGWSLGVIDTFDDVTNFIDGTRIDFPLVKAGVPVSINKSKGSKIELDQLLLVFVNEILQKPGDSYLFNGGSQITFTEPLKLGDTLNICFYKGSGDELDVIDREVIETIKYGDEVTLNYNPDLGQKPYQQENARTISSITNVDKCETLPYFGPGNTTDTTFERPVTWCRQTQDKIINGQEVGKDREIYEPVINPVANIISSVGIGSTVIYVDRLRPLFDLNNENAQATFRNTIQKEVKLVNPVVVTGAAATAVVSSAGTITSIVINNGGVGYSTTPDVSVGVGIGSTSITATAEATIANGVVTGVTITNPGSGYTTTNPPLVLIGPPAEQTELCDVIQNTGYSGDSGIIVGLGTTSIGVGSTGMIFHLHIPLDSEMRDANLVGTAVTLSGISTGDYFIVRNSNLGAASTSISALGTDNATVVGIGSEFLDNVYVVNKMELETQVIAGVSTNVIKVSVNTNIEPDGITGLTTGAFLGEYSWGKVNLEARTKEISYPAHTMSGIGTNGLTGISTSSKLYRSRYIRFKKFT